MNNPANPPPEPQRLTPAACALGAYAAVARSH